jgi:hypothetical protein
MKTPRVYGARKINIAHETNSMTTIDIRLIAAPGYNAHHMMGEKWDEIFPGDVIVKCRHCGRWAARKTACGSCGANTE